MSKKKLTYWERERADIIRDIKPKKRALEQAEHFDKHGWSDCDLWSLDLTFAKWFTPRLKRLLEIKFETTILTKKEKKQFEDLLAGFIIMSDDDKFNIYQFGLRDGASEQDKEDYEKIDKSLKLFPKLLRNLWY